MDLAVIRLSGYVSRDVFDYLRKGARYVGSRTFVVDLNTFLRYASLKGVSRTSDIRMCVEKVNLIWREYRSIAERFGSVEVKVKDVGRVVCEELSKRYVAEVYERGGYIIIKFPIRLTSDEYDSLIRKYGSVTYYIRKFSRESGASLVERNLRLIKWDRDLNAFVTYYPMLRYIVEWARKHGFNVVNKGVKIPFTKIKVKEDVLRHLRNYQRAALKAWMDNDFFGTVVIPTGGGKTYIGLAAIAKLSVTTAVFVTTKELAEQWRRKIKEVLGVQAGLLGGGTQDIRPITVVIYNSGVKYLSKISELFTFHIYDEGHHLPADTFKEIALRSKAMYRLVLTATPERGDKNHEMIYKIAGGIVYRIPFSYLVKRGFVIPIKHEVVYVDLTNEERKKYERAGSISTLMSVALNAKAKLIALAKILKDNRGKKTLVFTEFLKQAKEAYGVACEVLGKDKVGLITGSTSPKERKRLFEAFKRGRIPVIVTTKVLDEGIDVPDAEVAVIMSGTGQTRQMVQRVGRVVRASKGGASVAKIYEIVTRRTIDEKLFQKRYEGIKGLIVDGDVFVDAYRKRGISRIKLSKYVSKFIKGEKEVALFTRKRVLELSKKDLRILRKLHMLRPSRSRKIDEMRKGKIPKKVMSWLNNPSRYDIEGIDTPDVGRKRKSRGKKVRAAILRRLKAPIEKCVIKKTKNGRYAVICYHEGKPVMHGAYISKEMAEVMKKKLTGQTGIIDKIRKLFG